MAYRNVIIESPGTLSVRRSQLVIHTDSEHSIPIEDLSVLLIENRQVTITAAAMSLLGQSGCTVFFCDDRHMPCACMTPFMQHSRNTAVIRQQLEMSEPLKKQLWKNIIVAKINNQAACLEQLGKKVEARSIRAFAVNVRSGDTGNVEATAAARYFKALFDSSFL